MRNWVRWYAPELVLVFGFVAGLACAAARPSASAEAPIESNLITGGHFEPVDPLADLRAEVAALRREVEALKAERVRAWDGTVPGNPDRAWFFESVFDGGAILAIDYAAPPMLRPPWRERAGDTCTCYRDVASSGLPGVVSVTYASECPCEGEVR